MIELWKTIPDYEKYQVSNFGRVKSFQGKTERILKAWTDGGGYLKVNLSGYRIKVHKLVAIIFLGHKPSGMKSIVRHLDGNKLNNNLNNLAIGSQKENMNDKPISGRSKYRHVSWSEASKKWRSTIRLNGTKFHLGLFKTETRALIAYQFALFQLDKLKELM